MLYYIKSCNDAVLNSDKHKDISNESGSQDYIERCNTAISEYITKDQIAYLKYF